MSNIFQQETLNLFGGFIIPPFILADPNLDKELKFHLSEYLQIHQFSNGKIKLRVVKCNCCDHHERYCDMIDQLEEKNYITVTKKREMENCTELKIRINPWYLEYIDIDPFYSDYQEEYSQFLKDVVLPELPDGETKDKLINYILDNSI